MVTKSSHFATFPPKLVEPCILAGTSEKGCCSECGAPWARLVERQTTDPTHVSPKLGNHANRNDADRLHRVGETHSKTTGWLPTCDHGSDPVPCVCLDPFSGAGTVGLVAQRLQRDAVLIEISPEYAEMSRKRIHGDMPLFANVKVEEGVPTSQQSSDPSFPSVQRFVSGTATPDTSVESY